MIFFVYVDRTDDGRPFYVGKGLLKRTKTLTRNAYWYNIAAKHGQRREVVLATKDEAFAFEHEKQLIAELGTFEDGTPGRWGANLSEGGEGPSGWKATTSTRARMKQAWLERKNREPWLKGLTKETDERVAKHSRAMSGQGNPMHGIKPTASIAATSKPVEKLDLEGNITSYSSLAEAARELKADISFLSRACRGKAKTAYGFRWRFSD